MTASTMSSRHLEARCSCWSAYPGARHLRELTRRGHHALARWEATAPPAADVTGSAVLVWRFRAERREPVRSHAAEARAATVVAVALAVVSPVLVAESAAARASGSRPGESAVALS
jgi:hypothetical protein